MKIVKILCLLCCIFVRDSLYTASEPGASATLVQTQHDAAMPLVALFAWAATSSVVSTPVTINVRDFGALGDGEEDACFAFNQSIEAARATNATEIYIPHGTYHFYWHSCGQWAPLIYVSNTVIAPLPPKPIALWLRGLHDLVVDGDGSTLLMHGLMTPIAIDHRHVAYYYYYYY